MHRGCAVLQHAAQRSSRWARATTHELSCPCLSPGSTLTPLLHVCCRQESRLHCCSDSSITGQPVHHHALSGSPRRRGGVRRHQHQPQLGATSAAAVPVPASVTAPRWVGPRWTWWWWSMTRARWIGERLRLCVGVGAGASGGGHAVLGRRSAPPRLDAIGGVVRFAVRGGPLSVTPTTASSNQVHRAR
jgi:hypothetical protein